MEGSQSSNLRLPEWLRPRHIHSELNPMKRRLRRHGIATVCEEARCPNKSECFGRTTATFLILGTRCTRNCGFCSVEKGAEGAPDPGEPMRVARAAAEMRLRYVVVTSVTRDDLPDGGASHFSETVRAVRSLIPGVRVEVLTPDFLGAEGSIHTVIDSGPDVFNHNVETVPSLYGTVRPQADYERSLRVLEEAKRLSISNGSLTKSGLMLGLGESLDEVYGVFMDLRRVGCDMLTVGQYLRPSRGNLPVAEYLKPELFDRLRDEALAMGFRYVASSPLARSSMNAEEMFSMEKEADNV